MDHSELNRRDFQRLSMAALGGMLLGAGAADAAEEKDEKNKKNPLLTEPHVCRGLNTCKGKGADKKNACAGQGACATVKHHTCGGQNACRGQGGCGAHPGENECKGMGSCSVPLHAGKTWERTRIRFEELMKKEDKKVGPAPKAKKKD
jgi:hypothetical protein